MNQPAHRLSNKDFSRRIADCAVCGPGIKINKARKGHWRCAIKVRQEVAIQNAKGRVMPDGFSYTAQQKDKLVSQQGGKCAICKDTQPLEFDHNHQTLTPRGILCHKCNTGLGMFNDDLSRVESAAEYLRFYQLV